MQCFFVVACALVALMSISDNVNGLIESIPMPTTLLDCFGYKTEVMNITEIPAQSINSYCIDAFLRTTYESRFHYNVTEDTYKWVQALLRSIASKHDRQKRQTITPARRLRQEVRMMTPGQWNRFTGNVNRLKNDMSIQPNLYDALALLHQGTAEASAHGGSNFLGWHCIYLLVFEEALRVPVPYWDSTLDYHMNEPVESILWTRYFYGNGNGQVVTGPFAYWQTPAGPLRRSINSGNALMMPMSIEFVLSRTRHSQIVEPQQDTRFSLEAHHNGVHNWVDGLLAGLSTSAMDPVFFLHHSFIEQIWHRFKDQQDRAGVQRRYFPSGGQLHQPFRRMDGFPWYRNIDGYHDYFRFLVMYEPSPSCPGRCSNPSWDFPVMQCNTQGLCESGTAMNIPSERQTVMATRMMSAPMGDAPMGDAPMAFGATAFAEGPVGRRFGESPFIDTRTRGGRGKRSIKDTIGHTSAVTEMFAPYQNSFYLNGVVNIKNWVFVLVKVTSEHPHQMSSQNLMVSKSENNTDLELQPATYPKCSSSGSGLKKVFVQSHGFNYEGKFKNYVILDDQVPNTSDVTFIGFKNPEFNVSEAYASAYDLCGRVCRPKCLVFGSDPPEYRLCSGTIRLSIKKPSMYFTTYDEAEMAATESSSGGKYQSTDKKHPIFIEFVCKNEHAWPWDHLLGRK